MQESMGPITDREREHLGTIDRGIIAARRFFIAAARNLRESGEAPAERDPAAFRLKAGAAVLRRDQAWLPAMRESLLIPPNAAEPIAIRYNAG